MTVHQERSTEFSDDNAFVMKVPPPLSVNYTTQNTERFMKELKANGITAVMRRMKGYVCIL